MDVDMGTGMDMDMDMGMDMRMGMDMGMDMVMPTNLYVGHLVEKKPIAAVAARGADHPADGVDHHHVEE